MRTVSVTLFVVVVALGLSACLGDDFFDDDYSYGQPLYSGGYVMSYPQYGGMSYGKGYGKGYGHGYGKGYGKVESTVIRAPYAVPFYPPPPPAALAAGGDDGIFGGNGLLFLLLLLPFLLNNNGGLLG
ncbi:sulfur globule protein CV1-like [Ylistrum balloti]|uniref:sulfur globule protein CV1-like n=1 Tax=Ylistrum balloti TaxID=509963 RepID=UPI002905DEDD|nr:sulfur globule protein CV1-like [Ylistrum balloti]